jgi:hypothetical protein
MYFKIRSSQGTRPYQRAQAFRGETELVSFRFNASFDIIDVGDIGMLLFHK